MEQVRLRHALEDGLLSFPITDFDSHGEFAVESYVNRLKWFLEHDISAIFVAGGTGEFFSLTENEYEILVQNAVAAVDQKVPVIASAGRSVKEAIRFARISEKAGIDALLLFPPYLTECPADGIYEYARSILSQTSLPIIYYNRCNGVLPPEQVRRLADECPNLIGLKDGTGNIQDLNDTIRTVGGRLSYIGGVPTAEILAEAYLSIGVNTYSSAVFNFVPQLANAFYKSLRAGDKTMVDMITREFYIPLIRLRGKKAGYAVSLIKAGADLIGRSAGSVRPPLVMPSTEEVSLLNELIAVETRICSASNQPRNHY